MAFNKVRNEPRLLIKKSGDKSQLISPAQVSIKSGN